MKATNVHVPTSQRYPVIPTTRQKAMNRPTAQYVAAGESMNLTKADSIRFFHSMEIVDTHKIKIIRFRGNAINEAGKSPVSNWMTEAKDKYITNIIYGMIV